MIEWNRQRKATSSNKHAVATIDSDDSHFPYYINTRHFYSLARKRSVSAFSIHIRLIIIINRHFTPGLLCYRNYDRTKDLKTIEAQSNEKCVNGPPHFITRSNFNISLPLHFARLIRVIHARARVCVLAIISHGVHSRFLLPHVLRFPWPAPVFRRCGSGPSSASHRLISFGKMR